MAVTLRPLVLALASLSGSLVRHAQPLTGLVLLSVGASLAWLPAGFMVAGLVLLADKAFST